MSVRGGLVCDDDIPELVLACLQEIRNWQLGNQPDDTLVTLVREFDRAYPYGHAHETPGVNALTGRPCGLCAALTAARRKVTS